MTIQVLDQAQAEARRLPLTFEEYLRMPDDGQKAEWVNGEVIVYMPASIKHQALISFLDQLLGLFVRLFDLGIVLTDRIAMRGLPEGAAREPDVLFVANEHRDRLTPTYLAGAADLVVEIISDDSVARDRADKFYEYQRAGISEYLIIDARDDMPRIDWYKLTQQGVYQAIPPDADARYYSTVLPGFWLRAEWLFQEPLPDPLETLAEIRGLSLTDLERVKNLLKGKSE